MRRAVAAVSLLALLALGGCSLDAGSTQPVVTAQPADTAALTGLTVDTGSIVPAVTGTWPMSFTGPAARQLSAGTGAKLAAGDIVTFDAATFDSATGVMVAETFSSSATTRQLGTQRLTVASKGISGPLFTALTHAQVGAYILAVAPDPTTQRPVLVVMRINSVVAPDATASPAAKPAKVDVGGVPKITLDAVNPTMAKPAGAQPTATTFAILREGTGDPIQTGKDAVLQFAGYSWATAEAFDSTYQRKVPFRYLVGSGQGGVPCWDAVLPGVPAGTLLEIVCSAQDAYGANPPAGYPAGALVYLVEVLQVG